jgi:DNA polymerase III alpha subunit (gram-positive type)
LLIVIDIETTGLDPASSCIWGVGACAIKDGEIISEFETKVLPYPEHFTPDHRQVVKKVSELSLAEIEELWDAPKPSVAARNLQAWWCKLAVEHKTVPTFTSYNVEFDRKFLQRSPWNIIAPLWGECVMVRAAHAMDVEPKRDGSMRTPLWKACQHFEIVQEAAHNALDDARSAALVALKLEMA